MSPSSVWLAGARIRTLPAALVPVLVGTAIAARNTGEWTHGISWVRAFFALIVAGALQIGTNYANDYSDGIRGTDNEDRVGPTRLVGSGLVEPRQVKIAAFAAFGVAAIFGLVLAILVGWQLLVVGAASLLAGWFYTGGKNPYGYMGLGELFVFVFFGIVATVGSTYVQIEELTVLAFAGGSAVGLLAVALLVTNNLRDIETDGQTGKNTLAVRMGDSATRIFFIACIIGAFAIALLMVHERTWALLTFVALPLAVPPTSAVASGTAGPALIRVLGQTGRLQLAFGIALTIGLWISV